VTLLVVVGGLVWGVRRVSRAIDQASADSAKGFEQIARQNDQLERERLERGAKEQAARLASDAKEESARLLDQGEAAFLAGDYPRATELLGQLLERHPKRPEARTGLLFLAKARLGQHQLGDALAGFTSYLERYPSSMEAAEAQLRAGQSQAGLGLHAAAVSSYGAMMQRHPQDPLLPEALVLRGESQVALGQAQPAAADFQAALGKLGPADPLRARAEKGLASVSPKGADGG
jgi:TolA-binding protein